MRNKRSPWILVVLLLTGALIGGVAGELLARYPFFSWMSFGGANGYRELLSFVFNPLIDSGVVRFGFDFTLRINAGSIVGMILATLLFIRI